MTLLSYKQAMQELNKKAKKLLKTKRLITTFTKDQPRFWIIVKTLKERLNTKTSKKVSKF